jgi:uncharacterized membrane protein
MLKLLIIAFLANITISIASLFILPSQVAIHFGIGGMPNSWASKEFNAFIFIIIEIPLLVLCLYSSSWILKMPPKLINLPNKDYWLIEENKARFTTILDSLMLEFGSALFIFLLCVELLSLKANLSNPVRLDEEIFIILFVAFLAYTTYWCMKLYRRFRVPDIEHKKII